MTYLKDLYNQTEKAYENAQETQQQANRQIQALLPAGESKVAYGRWVRCPNTRTWRRRKNESAEEGQKAITDIYGDRGSVESDDASVLTEQDEFLKIKNIY
ncbi:hypothetical protein NB640_04640 [Oxalobacter vibrioformis]|uniref:Uncharacterized protein n=1 Tax=Oxalobacter vibrioformis TaxID=933080 RepID=A0A9E9M0H3_9BURK|nr:hypothetical protein [Oxalobacter vibrioformis]WAW10929.1 hypothetical protein NB640_04640 [Oxalobacter vibrioformis]